MASVGPRSGSIPTGGRGCTDHVGSASVGPRLVGDLPPSGLQSMVAGTSPRHGARRSPVEPDRE